MELATWKVSWRDYNNLKLNKNSEFNANILKGIEEKADYLKELGISAVWLTPIFESPMIDFGYDVSDFYNIARIFGTKKDFQSLKKKLHSLSEYMNSNYLQLWNTYNITVVRAFVL